MMPGITDHDPGISDHDRPEYAQSTKIIIRPPRVRFFSHQFKSFICEIDVPGNPIFGGSLTR